MKVAVIGVRMSSFWAGSKMPFLLFSPEGTHVSSPEGTYLGLQLDSSSPKVSQWESPRLIVAD